MAKRWTVTHTDALAWFDQQADEPRYHAAWFDPPYFLGSITKRFGKPNAAPAQHGKDGAFARTSKGFMGQTWDGFESALDFQLWITALGKGLIKVLYPGAVIAVCGSSRTWHRMAVGLEDAGFEIFDSIIWLYGSGWPKGKNVQQAITKLAGVRRNGVKKHPLADDILLGAALKWKGYNTVLKPAYEPIILARAPRQGRVADNALMHHTGALNIDGTRIPVIGERFKLIRDGASIGIYGNGKGTKSSKADGGTSEGRYPANIIMTHSESCRFMGYEVIDAKQTTADTHLNDSDGNGIYGKVQHKAGEEFVKYGDENGMETVESWDCAPDCPVGQLTAQSGITKSQGGEFRTANRHMDYTFGAMPREIRQDVGGASRFFYTGKAGTWERCAGLPKRAEHPTMKPIILTEYIARMLLPPPFEDGTPRRLIVPCSGEGSEMIGAILAGWDEVQGLELGAEYVQDAELRLAWWSRFRTYNKAKKSYNRINKVKPIADELDDESEKQMRLF